MDDLTVLQCIQDPVLIAELNEIIPSGAHRIRFVTEFKRIGQPEEVWSFHNSTKGFVKN